MVTGNDGSGSIKPWGLLTVAEQRERAVVALGEALDALAGRDRPLDDWEIEHLALGMMLFAKGYHGGAVCAARNAQAPPELRSPVTPGRADDYWRGATIPRFRLLLADLAALAHAAATGEAGDRDPDLDQRQ